MSLSSGVFVYRTDAALQSRSYGEVEEDEKMTKKKMTFRQREKGKHVKGWHGVPRVGKRCAFPADYDIKLFSGVHSTKYRMLAVPGTFERGNTGCGTTGWLSFPAAREWTIWHMEDPHRFRLAI